MHNISGGNFGVLHFSQLDNSQFRCWELMIFVATCAQRRADWRLDDTSPSPLNGDGSNLATSMCIVFVGVAWTTCYLSQVHSRCKAPSFFHNANALLLSQLLFHIRSLHWNIPWLPGHYHLTLGLSGPELCSSSPPAANVEYIPVLFTGRPFNRRMDIILSLVVSYYWCCRFLTACHPCSMSFVRHVVREYYLVRLIPRLPSFHYFPSSHYFPYSHDSTFGSSDLRGWASSRVITGCLSQAILLFGMSAFKPGESPTSTIVSFVVVF